jgi:hypothetical protein
VRLALAIACALALLAAAAPAGAAPAPMALGMQDPFAFQGELKGAQLELALARAREADSSIVRLGVSWRYYQKRKPKSRAQARDHRWKGYDWAQVDAEVRAVVAAGMQPLLAVGIAPRWFEGRGRPSEAKARPGTWRPSAEGLGDFARALAARFSGRSRDGEGDPLPRVRYFQAWNEPNVPFHMTPQTKSGRVASVAHYRGMLRAFYAGAKKVRADNFVLASGLAPFARLPFGVPPGDFTRELLCVNAAGTKAHRCRRVPFDAYAVHAYPQEDPRVPSPYRGDIRIRLDEITSALKLAARAGTISSRQAGRIWLTELGFAGGGDDPSPETQATWTQIALFMLWRQGVDAVIWWNLRDRAESVFMGRSGLFERGDSIEADRAKPAYTAFRFPLVFIRSGGGVKVWGRAPAPGTVAIEKEVPGGFEQIASVSVGAERVFQVSAPDPGSARLRLRQGSDTSLLSGVTDPAP